MRVLHLLGRMSADHLRLVTSTFDFVHRSSMLNEQCIGHCSFEIAITLQALFN